MAAITAHVYDGTSATRRECDIDTFGETLVGDVTAAAIAKLQLDGHYSLNQGKPPLGPWSPHWIP